MSSVIVLGAQWGDEGKGKIVDYLAQDAKYIHARAFEDKDKKWAYNKQGGICPYCHKHFDYEQMQGDHIKPWSKGGTTERDNLQMLCAECNGKKSGYDTGFTPWDGKLYEAFDMTAWDEQNIDETFDVAGPDAHGIPGFIHQ